MQDKEARIKPVSNVLSCGASVGEMSYSSIDDVECYEYIEMRQSYGEEKKGKYNQSTFSNTFEVKLTL